MDPLRTRDRLYVGRNDAADRSSVYLPVFSLQQFSPRCSVERAQNIETCDGKARLRFRGNLSMYAACLHSLRNSGRSPPLGALARAGSGIWRIAGFWGVRNDAGTPPGGSGGRLNVEIQKAYVRVLGAHMHACLQVVNGKRAAGHRWFLVGSCSTLRDIRM